MIALTPRFRRPRARVAATALAIALLSRRKIRKYEGIEDFVSVNVLLPNLLLPPPPGSDGPALGWQRQHSQHNYRIHTATAEADLIPALNKGRNLL